MNITAIIIARNEEKNISQCIEALSFVKEVIVVDNCSFDKTAALAKKMGAKVYTVSGLDFSYLRNIGKEKAGSEWLFYLDADERVTKELAAEIKQAVGDKKGFAAFSILRKNYYFAQPWPKIEEIVRLMRKNSLIGWQGSLHETPIVAGKIGKLFSYLLHYTHSNISSMIDKTNEWSEIEAQLRYKNNHPKMVWWRFLRVIFSGFYNSYIYQGGWKLGTTGFIESVYQAFSYFITYAKLWEKQNQ